MGMKLLRKADSSHSPPSDIDILCCTTEPRQKSGAVLVFLQRFGHEDFIERKSLLKVFKKSLDMVFFTDFTI
jgi:hypothetical protein